MDPSIDLTCICKDYIGFRAAIKIPEKTGESSVIATPFTEKVPKPFSFDTATAKEPFLPTTPKPFPFSTPQTQPEVPPKSASETKFTFGGSTSANSFAFGSANAPTAKPAVFSFGVPSPTTQTDFSIPPPTVNLGLSSMPTPLPLSNTFSFTKPATGFSFGAAPNVKSDVGEDEDAMPLEVQADLSKGEGEESEITLFEVKARIQVMDKEKRWVKFGVGQFKVNESSDGVTRILCRADTGKLFVNCRLYKGMTINKQGDKTISACIHIDGNMTMCLIQVGKETDRDSLATTLSKAVERL